ncbi:MAG: adenosine deaminase [Vulcanimicrobiaceae bacterium]
MNGAAASSPSALVHSLPKVQLHCHLEGTLAAASFLELAEKCGLQSERALGGPERAYAHANFREFLLTFAEVCRVLAEPDDFARLAREFARAARAQNVRHAEVFVSPSVWAFFHRNLDASAALAAIVAAFRAEDLSAALIVDLTRNFGLERAQEAVAQALAWAENGFPVVGIGLGGDEANFPAEMFSEPFARARAAGLHAVAHAGEAAGAASVRAAVELLGAERIGHGIRVLEDAAVVGLLRERGVTLEVCPTSNYRTGVVAAAEVHPLGALLAAGLPCALDADDPALFETTLEREYAFVETTLGSEAALRCARAAISGSFASAERQAAWLAELAACERAHGTAWAAPN